MTAVARGLGYRRDLPDARDKLFAAHPAAAVAFPAFASVDDPSVPPKDQGQTSSCVGNAETQGLRLAYHRRGIYCPELSAMSVYRLARNIDGTSGDEGTFLRSGVQAIQHFGPALESAWPFDEHAINAQLTFSALRSAYDRNGLRGYHRVDPGSIAQWKAALAAGFPVVAGWDVSERFCASDGRSVVQMQQGAMAGGHAIACIGYGSSEHFSAKYGADFGPNAAFPLLFELINSWGHAWGYNGRFLATPAFIQDATDCWALDVSGGHP